MSDHTTSGIPPVFLRDIDDQPAPPPPPEADERDDDGDKGPHIRFVRPILMVLSDGSINTDGWRGMLLQGWLWGSSLFTAYVLLAGLSDAGRRQALYRWIEIRKRHHVAWVERGGQS